MELEQFYPTPESLARKAWGKFQNRNFFRVLEPSAGVGDLVKSQVRPRDGIEIDCCEIDISKHPVLREKGITVVGVDFMELESAAAYSHIIMNPPFKYGVKHVLKAWDILFDGEIVAILNAESIRNPYSSERQMLKRIIEQHGSVEFIEEAFMDPDTKRKTDVEVALIHLVKKASGEEIVGSILENLRQDSMSDEKLAEGYRQMSDLAIPGSFIENAVLTFNAAVRAMRESVMAEARAGYYAGLIGETLAEMNGGVSKEKTGQSLDFVRSEIGKRYGDLKRRAWSNILRSTQVMAKLSSAAQRRMEAEFGNIERLEFSVSNIHGFLLGIAQSQGEIQIGMACDVFDEITRYHTDNTVYYRGWKSNDKHRTCGMKVKGTRIVLPGHRVDSWRSTPQWSTLQTMRDFDRVFAMLDGKPAPDYGLADLFETRFDDLRQAKRMSTDYFDVRYYKGTGTIHLYPRDTKLIDRLNRVVGRHRQWLPPESETVPEQFWLQYDRAEKMDEEFRRELNLRNCASALQRIGKVWHVDEQTKAKAENVVCEALESVQKRHGISLELEAPSQPLLLAA